MNKVTIPNYDIFLEYIAYFDCKKLLYLPSSPYSLFNGKSKELKRNKKYDLFFLLNYTSYKKLVFAFETSIKHSTKNSLFIISDLALTPPSQAKSVTWYSRLLSRFIPKKGEKLDAFKFLFYLYKKNYSLCTVSHQEKMFSIVWKSSIKFSYQFDENFLQKFSMSDMKQYAWIYFPVPYSLSFNYIGLNIDSYLYKTNREYKKIFKK